MKEWQKKLIEMMEKEYIETQKYESIIGPPSKSLSYHLGDVLQLIYCHKKVTGVMLDAKRLIVRKKGKYPNHDFEEVKITLIKKPMHWNENQNKELVEFLESL